MTRLTRVFVHGVLVVVFLSAFPNESNAVRIMTNPATEPGDPAFEFHGFTLTPNGNTIVANGLFQSGLTGDRVYSFPVPANPLVDTVALTQLSTSSFSVNQNYDAGFSPVISPNGQTILYTHDGNTPRTNSIYTMPIGGELTATSFTGLFGADPNLASPGNGSRNPIYSPDGSTVYFLNSNSGFNGAPIPSFAGTPAPWASSGPDWDRIYSVPVGGGTPTAITAPSDGDVDFGMFALTPDGSSIVYAADNPIIERKDRGDVRTKLFAVSSTGGASTEISIPTPSHDFSFARQLEISSDGQSVFFVGDYEQLGKNELFSVPIAGGTPTRISDDLPWSGDVSSFAISPNGTQVAYAAGQNTGSSSELFLTPISGGVGNSIRVSDPASSNSGSFDVSTTSGRGQIAFSNDSSQLYYLGDFETNGVKDVYVVDTTEKTGLVPSPYYYTGPSDGDFFDEANWNDMADGSGNAAPDGSIDPGVRIQESLIIDGDMVSSGTPFNGVGRKAIFEQGSSLEMTPGSVLDFPESQDEIEFLFGSGVKLTDATMSAFEDIFFHGTTILSGGIVESVGDDIEFQDAHDTTINGTIIRSNVDNILFDNSLTSVTGATFISNDRLGLRHEVDIRVMDSSIDVNDGNGDIEDIFAGPQAEGSTLTLDGASTLKANAIQEGVTLFLDGSSIATLLGNDAGGFDLVDANGTITFLSAGASLVTLNASATDVRSLIINGLTGLSYLQDDSAWNVAGWDGTSPLASLQLIATTPNGDFNGDTAWDCLDIDALVEAVSTSSSDLSFDMNGDGIVSLADITDAGNGWLAVGGANNAGETGGNPFLVGDANLDGVVDGQDFLIWSGHKFTSDAAWCSGDFNADGSIDGHDFLHWNANKFSSSNINAIPEPATFLPLILVALAFVTRQQS